MSWRNSIEIHERSIGRTTDESTVPTPHFFPAAQFFQPLHNDLVQRPIRLDRGAVFWAFPEGERERNDRQ